MDRQLTLLCSHVWLCPPPDSLIIICVCKLCGAKKEMKTYFDYQGFVDIDLRYEIPRIKRENPIDQLLEKSRREKLLK